MACKRDIRFHLNTFGWLFEPRNAKVLPFITYPFQDEFLLQLTGGIRDAGPLNPQDIVVAKSRDMGASWCCLAALEWLWHFHGRQTFLLLSRKEDLVDKRGDMAELFAKIDFMHDYQPGWLLPNVRRMKMLKENMDSMAGLKGESTNVFAGVADRKRAILLDEFSKMDNQDVIFTGTRDVTDCRIFNYTPNGSANMAYEIAEGKAKDKFTQVRLHWSRHPIKRQGLYRVDKDGKIEIVDTQWHEQNEYECRPIRPKSPIYDFRSPWYDYQCDRSVHEMEIAQELDIDFLGSDYQFFEPHVLEKVLVDCCDPLRKCELDYDSASLNPRSLVDGEYGSLWMWREGPESGHQYVLGCDIATGTGATNSVMAIIDKNTHEQVGEYANSRVQPDEFGRMAVAIARYFNGAKLVWEAPGPGRNFGNAVIDSGYRNIYYRRDEDKIGRKMSQVPGWWPTKDNKRQVMQGYKRGLSDGTLIVHSGPQIEECRRFVYTATGWIQHSGQFETSDPSGARENHGDRPTACALAWHEVTTTPMYSDKIDASLVEWSFAWRQENAERERAEAGYW